MLYEQSSRSILGQMSATEGQCMTSKDYVSCDVDKSETSHSTLRALVADLAEGQWRVYGCNVTALLPGGFVQIFSWSETVRRIPSK